MAKNRVCLVPSGWTEAEYAMHSCGDGSHVHLKEQEAERCLHHGIIAWMLTPRPKTLIPGEAGSAGFWMPSRRGITTTARRYSIPEVMRFLKKPEREKQGLVMPRDLSCYVGGPLAIALQVPSERWWANAMLSDIMSPCVA